jgi:hypothetical protein
MRGTFNLTGIDKYLEAFAAAGKNVDQVVAEVLQEAQPLALELMRDELKMAILYLSSLEPIQAKTLPGCTRNTAGRARRLNRS